MKISIHHIVTQKVGNSVGFSLPASFKVEVGTEYTIHQKFDGSLILIPKISNPYTSDAKFEDVKGSLGKFGDGGITSCRRLNLNKEILYGQIFHLQLDKK